MLASLLLAVGSKHKSADQDSSTLYTFNDIGSNALYEIPREEHFSSSLPNVALLLLAND